MYTYVYICVYVCVCVYVCMYMYMYVCVYLSLCGRSEDEIRKLDDGAHVGQLGQPEEHKHATIEHLTQLYG